MPEKRQGISAVEGQSGKVGAVFLPVQAGGRAQRKDGFDKMHALTRCRQFHVASLNTEDLDTFCGGTSGCNNHFARFFSHV